MSRAHDLLVAGVQLAKSRGGWLLLAGQVIPKIAATVTVFATSAILGPDGRGVLAFVMGSTALLSAMTGFGLFIPAARERGPVSRQYLDISVAFTLAADVVIVLLALLAPTGLFTTTTAVLIALNSVFSVVTVFAQRVLQARVSDREYFLIGVMPILVSTITLLILVLIVPSVDAYLWVWTILNAAAMMWALSRLWRQVRPRVRRPYAAMAHLRRAAPVGLSILGTMMVLRGDVTVLGLRSTEYELGQYSIAIAIASLPLIVGEVFALRAVSGHVTCEADQYGALVARLARMATVSVAALAVPLVFLGWVTLTWLLPAFTPAIVPMVLLCVAAIPGAYSRVQMAALGMVHARRRLYVYSAASAALFLLYVPAAAFGATGMAITAVVVYTAQTLFLGGRRALRLESGHPPDGS